MTHADFPKGSKVSFKPGPRSTSYVKAEVTGHEGMFLITKDDAGKERRTRPGSCTKA